MPVLHTSPIHSRRIFAVISHPDTGIATLTEKLLLIGAAVQLAGVVVLSGTCWKKFRALQVFINLLYHVTKSTWPRRLIAKLKGNRWRSVDASAARQRDLSLLHRLAPRAVLFLLVMLGCLLNIDATVEAKPALSAIVVDARTGKILSSLDPDGIRHPASLTKMMTLYVLFQDLNTGKIKIDSPIRISARAAGKPASKLGVPPGSTITVELAIQALVVKSANDVASAVAETLGGTESNFAKRMTSTAHSIGMKDTTFRNASGLPETAQVTTARDMATLGLRLQRDFAQYYPYFRTRTFTHGGKIVTGHNRLLGNYEGTDGIKTGYIKASGFNLVTSTRRGGKRLVGVVIGGKSSATRDAYMRSMLDKTFAKGTNGKTIAALAGSSKGVVETSESGPEAAAAETKAPEPDSKSLAALAGISASDESREVEIPVGTKIKSAAAPESKKLETKNARNKKASATKVAEAKIELPTPPDALPFGVKQEAQQDDIVPDIAHPSEDAQAVPTAPADAWHIQIGSYDTEEDATASFPRLRKTGFKMLQGKRALTVTVQKGEKITYRARFSGFTEKSARDACAVFNRRNTSCNVVVPNS